MAGIFPNPSDGGEAPNDRNRGQVPLNPPIGTQALYYSAKCGSKIQLETINAIIAEISCAVDELDRIYNSNSLCNLSLGLKAHLAILLANRIGPQGPPGICPPCP